MPQRLGPRFAIEAIFIVLVAIAAGVAGLGTVAIVLVIAIAWLLVALTELIASYERPSSLAPPPLLESRSGEEAVPDSADVAGVYPPWPGEPERAEAQTLLGAVVPVDPDAPADNGEHARPRADPWEEAPAARSEPAPVQPERRLRRWFTRRRAAGVEAPESASEHVEPPRHVRRIEAGAEQAANADAER